MATRARALEEMRRSIHGLRTSLRSHAERFELSCSGRLAELGESASFNVLFTEPGGGASRFRLASCAPCSGTMRDCVSGRVGLLPINAALVW
eukprot:6091250-Pleurochrysis_carterae.AAC.2